MSFKVWSNGSFTRGGAIGVVVFLLLAVPVAAEVSIQNFLAAEVTTSAPCFTETAGSDASSDSGLLSFESGTAIDEEGIDLLQETLLFRSFAGERLIYSQAIEFNNDCGHDLQVSFVSSPDPAANPAVEPESGGIWADTNVAFYIQDPAGVAVAGLTGTYVEMMSMVAGELTTPGLVTITDGESRTVAVVLAADDGATVGQSGTLRWSTIADHG